MIRHNAVAAVCKVMLLLFDKSVYSVQSNSAVIADNSSSSVCVGKSCDDFAVSCLFHFGSVCAENPLVMRAAVLRENLVQIGAGSVTVCLASLLSHLDSAERHERSFKRLVRLKTYNLFHVLCIFADIAGVMRCQR